ncbi:hypothetical protein [Flavobacterium daejeonense]|uniref:hypothetical protein n=1 Tax=Flavobacterium daejeonense TaxID=350893 RepID=UPI000479B4BC|nr:hypothetical protein [Flavobacterium daejeonense]
MKKNIYLLSFFIILLSCAKEPKLDFKNGDLNYDQSLAIIQSIKIVAPKITNCPPLGSHLNLNYLGNKKVEINKIVFKNYNSFPLFWDLSYLKNSLTGYCYGMSCVLGNNLYLYTEDFKDDNKKNEENQYHQVGLLLIEKNNNFVTWVKVSETDIDSEKSLESFLYDNYIIIIETNNWNYDVVESNKKKQIKYRYVVLEIKGKGNLIVLNKKESNKIITKYF